VSSHGKQLSELSKLHFLALAELSKKNRRRIPVSEWPEWSKLNTTLNHLTNSQNNNIPSQVIRKLNMMRDSIDENKMVPFHLAHGDFTPWNMFVKKEKLALIDWELSQASAPALFDLFHFLYQQSSLVDKASFPSTIIKIQTALDHPAIHQLIKANHIDTDLHHSLYLLFTAVYYLNLYSKYDQWSPQQRSSIQIWNNGLNHALSKGSHISMRSLFLLDMFAHLKEQRYALLKSPVLDPFQLPEGSDIDICTDSKTNNALSVFISKHPLVQNLKRSRKSFMTVYSILLHDGSFLGVDAITRFKRKDLVMMDALELLNTTRLNTHEVMIPSPEQDMKYIYSFYLLNNAPIPEKYQNLYHGLKPNRFSNAELVKALKARPENLGFRKMANRVNYLIDTFRESFFKKGFVITFSGVDGAGKSTVIESVKHQIEKNYRRKVIVLRHRPALLPMLTAWKHGKVAAEQNAAARLPRQGSNNSTLSSLLRFAYYYTDYLIGQFNVQVKYVWRGYIVLYDRYYFDFINDGKRSNIVLPNWFTRFWYTFLIKPSFNFFLYADAATILNRKKELDEHTIKQLTVKYLDLFKLFGKKFRGSKYIPVRNEQLPATMDLILQTIKTRSI
jgi:thymidylate kinase